MILFIIFNIISIIIFFTTRFIKIIDKFFLLLNAIAKITRIIITKRKSLLKNISSFVNVNFKLNIMMRSFILFNLKNENS